MIEECAKPKEHDGCHHGEQQQLSVQEATEEPPQTAPPPPALRVHCLPPPTRGHLRAEGQGDGQSVCDRVDLHVDRQAVQRCCPRQTTAFKTKNGRFLRIRRNKYKYEYT